MAVLVTGGAGFLGSRVAARFLERAAASGERVVIADTVPPPGPLAAHPAVEVVLGDLRDEGFHERCFDAREDDPVRSVFHLAAVVSAAAEADFDLGMSVNLQGTLMLLERCRALPHPPRLVFASSVAAYGPVPGGEVVEDRTLLAPRSSYGTQKALGELLVRDYSRRGFIDGRAVRLPTIAVRPGRPNQAASSFASSIVREPLQGEEAVCPVPPELEMWLLSPRRALEALVRAHDLAPEAIGEERAIALPGLTVRVGELIEALGRVAGPEVAARVRMERDPFIEGIVGSWPARFRPERGLALGFEADPDAESIVRAFIEDELGGRIA